MKGIYNIKIYNKHVYYELTFRRNITIISGNSGTGKTIILNLIDTYYNKGKQSGIHIESQVECVVLREKNWHSTLSQISNSIVFIDEGAGFINTKQFATAVQQFDNYYVIITRQSLSYLSYSINEIYKLEKKHGETYGINQTYNTMSRLYNGVDELSNIKPDKLLVEDSNSGFEFFNIVGSKNGLQCLSAKGKSNISKIIDADTDKITKSLAIADGASFGNEMQKVMAITQTHRNWFIFLPESFEWILIKSKVVNSKKINVDDILLEPSNYIDSNKFVNWERYFTYLIDMILKEYEQSYTKQKLNNIFKQPKAIEKILESINQIKLK